MSDAAAERSAPDFLMGGGQTGALMRAHHWATTPLPKPSAWPQPLKTLVSVMLMANQPMFVAWGPKRTLLYNDAYAEILAAKHPAALGQDFLAVWSEIRTDLMPIVEQAYAGKSVHMDDIELVLLRKGYPEKTHFAFSYTPVRDQAGAVAGFFCPCIETTEHVLAERRRAADTERQRRLFEQAPGFITVLHGPQHVFEFVNAAYRRLFGNHEYLGRTVREVFPELEGQNFFERLDGVYQTGQRFVADHIPVWLKRADGQPEERRLNFIYEPVIDETGRVIGIFVEGHDVTDAHRADVELRASAARQAFRLAVEERLRDLAGASDIIAAATEALGRHLDVAQVAYAEVEPDGETVLIERDWNTGTMAGNARRHRLDDYGPPLIADLRQGKTISIADVSLDPRTSSPRALAAFAQAWITGLLDIPIVKAGRLVAILGVHSETPRTWSAEEVALAEELADRIWSAAERARAEAELRESEARLRTSYNEANRNAAELRKNEEQLRLATEAAEIGLWDVDGTSDALFWPPRVKAMFGISADRPVSMTDFFNGLHPDDKERVSAAYQAAADPAQRALYDVEYRTIGKEDGILRWVAAKGRGVFDTDDTLARMIGTAIDITQRKQAEAALRESEAKLRALNADLERQVIERARERARTWQVSPELLAVMSPSGLFESVNPAWTATLGWSSDELAGAHYGGFVHPEDLARSEAAFLAVTHGEPVLRFENRYRHKRAGGGWHWLSWVAVPEGGKVYSSARDITTEKEQSEALLKAEDQLRQSQKMEAVGQLTGGLAHDFNNLLTGITGSLELLQARLRQGRLGEIDHYIVAAQGAAKRAAALTHRLLAFSRRQTLDPKPVSLNRLVAGMEELIRRTVGPAITVEVVTAGGLWTTLIDAGQLENALLNLCINARDAMPEGGRLTIETANKWLDERAARERELPPGQYVAFSVSDTGCGMTTEVMRRAFDPFYTTKPIGLGTGLGLSMVYGFARQSGGQVRIYSELGQGTLVCLYLPRFAGAEEPADEPGQQAEQPQAAQGETVLVVDDEPTVRMLITEVLADMGYAVLDAADGAAGLAILQSKLRLDLLVTDVGLPNGMNGRQLADAARAIRPGLKVLFVTGYAENAVVGNGQLDSGMHVLTKPFEMTVIASRIKDIIASS